MIKPCKCVKCKGTDLFFLEHYDYYAYHRQVILEGKVYLQDEGNSMDSGGPSNRPVMYECKSCGHYGSVRYDTFSKLHSKTGSLDIYGKIKYEPQES